MWEGMTLTLVQVRVGELAADLFDDLDVIKVRRSLQPEDSVDGEVREVVLVSGENFRR